MYALKIKDSGKLMAVEPISESVHYKYDANPTITQYLNVLPPSQYNTTVFATNEKAMAYGLVKNKSYGDAKIQKEYADLEIEVVKLKIKKPKHRIL